MAEPRPTYGTAANTPISFGANLVFASAFNEGSSATDITNDVSGGTDGALINTPSWNGTDGILIDESSAGFSIPTSLFGNVHTLIFGGTTISGESLVGRYFGIDDSESLSVYAIQGYTSDHFILRCPSSGRCDVENISPVWGDDEYHTIAVQFEYLSTNTLWIDSDTDTSGTMASTPSYGTNINFGYHSSGNRSSNFQYEWLYIFDGVLTNEEVSSIIADPYFIYIPFLYSGTIDQSPTGIAKNTYVKIATVAPTDNTLTVTFSAAGSAGEHVVVADNVGITLAE